LTFHTEMETSCLSPPQTANAPTVLHPYIAFARIAFATLETGSISPWYTPTVPSPTNKPLVLGK